MKKIKIISATKFLGEPKYDYTNLVSPIATYNVTRQNLKFVFIEGRKFPISINDVIFI